MDCHPNCDQFFGGDSPLSSPEALAQLRLAAAARIASFETNQCPQGFYAQRLGEVLHCDVLFEWSPLQGSDIRIPFASLATSVQQGVCLCHECVDKFCEVCSPFDGGQSCTRCVENWFLFGQGCVLSCPAPCVGDVASRTCNCDVTTTSASTSSTATTTTMDPTTTAAPETTTSADTTTTIAATNVPSQARTTSDCDTPWALFWILLAVLILLLCCLLLCLLCRNNDEDDKSRLQQSHRRSRRVAASPIYDVRTTSHAITMNALAAREMSPSESRAKLNNNPVRLSLMRDSYPDHDL